MKYDFILPSRDPDEYFDGANLDADLIAKDCLARGPLAVGIDGRFWAYEGGVWTSQPRIVEQRIVYDLERRFHAKYVTTVEKYIAARVGQIRCDPTPDHINFRNGMLEWRTGKLLPHDTAYNSTVQLPYDWEPDAQCPQFDAFLNSILSPDYVALAWEMLGYLMHSGNELQVAFLFHGSGSNGKGTLIRVIAALLGQSNCSSASLNALNTNRFAAASLYGKIANLAGDIDATYQESTAAFKTLTGEDEFRTENKFADQFDFKSWAVPVFSANKVPGSADTSDGYLRRWIVLDFNQKFRQSSVIIGLSECLAAEAPGIAARALPHLQALMERGYFKSEGDVEKGRQHFAETVDSVRLWVKECCDTTDYTVEEKQTVLYKSYCWWVDANGGGKMKASEFYRRLDGIPIRAVQGGPLGRRYRGIRVVEYRSLDAVPTQYAKAEMS